MIVTVRVARTTAYRVFHFLREFKWTLLATVNVSTGIAAQFVGIPKLVLVFTAIFGGVLLSMDVVNKFRDRARTEFAPRSGDVFRDALDRLAPDARFRILTFRVGTFVHDQLASEQMRSPQCETRLAARSYEVPHELRPYGPRFLKHVLERDRLRFNGPCIGWNTDLADLNSWANGPIELVSGCHFQFVQSDELAMHDVIVDGRQLPEFGRSLFIKGNGALRDFRSSWLFNLIGASTIAITTDGKLVLTEQTEANMASKQQIAPSGSGSAEPQDFRGARQLPIRQLAINAATRELREEANIKDGEIGQSYFLGYGRWLDKAARGELLCVTFLNVDSHALRRRPVRISEKVYTRRVDPINFKIPVTQWDPVNPQDMLPVEKQHRMSVPLGAALSLLAEEAGRPGSPVLAQLSGMPIAR
ncbi:hypothetical protein ACWDUL_36685 [Nocardia niigatensis]|uniref:hypothetical protein n=1 Tax=Nocardia niigatensis TaxID=209249 RepID=UPI0005948569|nr:hypothetical protein [Nocardia niigatensis]